MPMKYDLPSGEFVSAGTGGGNSGIQVVPVSGSTVTLANVQGGKEYHSTETALTALNVVAVEDSPDVAVISFFSGSTATVCTWADTILMPNGETPTIEANMYYEFSIRRLALTGGGFKAVAAND